MGEQTPAMILMLETVAMMTLIILVLGMIFESRMAPPLRGIAIGVLMGTAVSVTQLHPMALGDGVYVDSRAVILSATGAFFGPLSLGIAWAFGLTTRLIQGGMGTEAGLLAMTVAAAVGLAWSRIVSAPRRRSTLGLLGLGLMVNLSMLPPAIYLPAGWRLAFYEQIGVPLFITNVVGLWVFGALIDRLFRLIETTAELRRIAQTDSLTGLANRAHFFEVIDQKAQVWRAQSLIYIDIDHFKSVNDRFGHATGDSLLRQLSARLKDAAPAGSTLARLGGEEFALLLPGLSEPDALAVADMLRETVATTPFQSDFGPLTATISLGVHSADSDIDRDALVNRADDALYLAKQQGRNRVVASSSAQQNASSPAARAQDRPLSERHLRPG